MTAKNETPLQPFSGGAAIPAILRSAKRWAPWRAEWNVKRSAWDKIPVRADNVQYGLSTANPDRWFTYDAALDAHRRSEGATHGVGYVMTRPHGIAGVDLDDAVADGVVEPWAQEIAERLGGYAEFSPSGRGLRIFVRGHVGHDWTNHQVGVEVYEGHTPRFLTVTGRHLPGTPTDVPEARPGALVWLAEKYRETAAQQKAKGDIPPMPLLLDAADLPGLDDLNLPPRAYDFLAEGDTGAAGDRSRVLHSTAVALFSAGLSDVQVMSLLFANPYALEVALDHRRQDTDRAADYLWTHHVVAAKPKAMGSILTAADWADEIERDYAEQPDEDAEPAAATDDVTGMFEDLGPADDTQPATKPKARDRFPLFQAAEYAAQSSKIEWLVPNVLPRAEVVSIFGESGAGKTFMVLDLAVRLAAGLPWWDKALKPRTVVYVAAEGAMGVRLRLQAMARQFGIDLAHLPLHIMPAQPNILANDDVKGLIRAIKTRGPVDLIILDTIAQVTPGANENSSEDMGKALAHCKTMHQVLDATVALVGHSGKNVNLGQRGWSGVKGAMDAQIEVVRTATYRAATVAKLKDGAGEGAEFMFNLLEVPLDFDADDGLVTSCVVDPVLSPVQQEAAREAAAAAGDRKRAGRPKGSGEWAGYIIQAAQNLCGPRNKPVHEQRLLDEAERIAKETRTSLPAQLKGSLLKGLKAVVSTDLLHHEEDDTYTLRAPPPTLEEGL